MKTLFIMTSLFSNLFSSHCGFMTVFYFRLYKENYNMFIWNASGDHYNWSKSNQIKATSVRSSVTGIKRSRGDASWCLQKNVFQKYT